MSEAYSVLAGEPRAPSEGERPTLGEFYVTLPSRAVQPVLTADEESYLRERVERYGQDNAFVNVSDLQDLDRMMVMELLTHRWGIWLAVQHDYDGRPVDKDSLADDLEKWSRELRQLKRLLGIDKVARDRQKGEGCHDAETEVLTEHGWLLFCDVSLDMRVATRTADGVLEYEYPTAYHEYDYDGELLTVETNRLNFAVTPSHRLLLKVPNKNALMFKRAEEITAPRFNYQIPRTAVVGDRRPGTVQFDAPDLGALEKSACDLHRRAWSEPDTALLISFYPDMPWPALCSMLGRSRRSIRDRVYWLRRHGVDLRRMVRIVHWKNRGVSLPSVPRDRFARWLGLWLSEGHKMRPGKDGKQRYTVKVCQCKAAGIVAIDRIFVDLGWPYRRAVRASGEVNWSIHSAELTEYVLGLQGDGHELHIPREVFTEWTKEEMEALLEGLNIGDGTYASDKRRYTSYSTTSRTLADDVQCLLAHIGGSGSVKTLYNAGRTAVRPNGQRIVAHHEGLKVAYRIARHGTLHASNLKRLRYIGKVYCLSVPNETLLTRRHGEVMWSGNSVPAFIASLTERAKLFGVSRERQLDRALELTNELIGLVTVSRNSDADPEVQAELHVTPGDIRDWIWNVYRPEFEEIDAHFRRNSQRYWVRSQ